MLEGIITSLLLLVILFFWLRAKGNAANVVDWGHPVVNVLDGLMRIYCIKFHRFEHDRFELPKQGGAVVLSNHISGVDPFLLLTASDRPLRFMIATEEYYRPVLHHLFKAVGCIPVDRTGRPEKAFREAIKHIKHGEIVALFPHGKIHTDDEPHRPIKKGGLRLASLSQSPIIPCRITGMRAQGDVFLPLFLRGTANLTIHQTINNHEIDELTPKLIESLILGKA